VLTPSGERAALMFQQADNAMIKALARAFRWREMLESGTHATITDLARAERIDHSYMGRILRLTLLAPDIVESIMNGRQSETVTIGPIESRIPALLGRAAKIIPIGATGRRHVWSLSARNRTRCAYCEFCRP
jgi:hypothetical protein